MQAKRLLLFGEQRSGTTLMLEMLNAHPAVEVVAPDFPLYTAAVVFGLRPRQSMSERKAHVLWQHVRAATQHNRQHLPSDVPSHVTCYDNLLAHRMQRQAPDAQFVCTKFHGPFETVPDLIELDDLFCLHMVRDVRDVLLSRAFRGEQQLDQWALQWRQGCAQIRRLGRHPRLQSIRFEDLIDSPSDAFARILGWLGLPNSEPMPACDAQGRPRLQNSSFGDLQAFDRSAVARYRGRYARPLMRYAQWMCRDELRHWGYPIEPDLDVDLPTRLRFVRRRATLAAIAAPRRAKNAITAALLPSLAD